MDKRDRNEQAFETLLAENLSAPPETVVAGVTPGHRALRRVLWGSALCTVTLQVSGLQYILPTVGLVLLLLGLRAAARESLVLRGLPALRRVVCVRRCGSCAACRDCAGDGVQLARLCRRGARTRGVPLSLARAGRRAAEGRAPVR